MSFKQNLKTKIFILFFAIIAIFAVLVFLLGAQMINNQIIARAQKQVRNDLRVAHSIFNDEIEAIRAGFNLIAPSADLSDVREKMGLDYLYIVKRSERSSVKSEIVQRVFDGRAIGGIRVIGRDELAAMGEDVYKKCAIDIRFAPQSRPRDAGVLEEAMAIGYAIPVFNKDKEVESVIYGGKIINRDFALVDKIRGLVFENKFYDKKPLGTVTIFLRDIRIATNVLDSKGNRAIGTPVSEIVSKKVLGEGKLWLDRAFVVTDWYLTAYEPVRNINGEIIGILYVGILERPFKDLERRTLLTFLSIILLVGVLAVVSSYVLAKAIARPVGKMLEATDKLSQGDLKHKVDVDSDIKEFTHLAVSFNQMTAKLDEQQEKLRISNEKLVELNKNYLDLIGFVSHELKGMLSPTILNAYSVRDGFLGFINFKQRRALDSVARNLDYLEAMVRNFLDLSRIERDELSVKSAEILCKEDVFDPAISNFKRQADEKNMSIVNNLAPGLRLKGDVNLLQIVANNLISNAIKYGKENGKIIVCAIEFLKERRLQVEVYNEGRNIGASDKDKLFKRFSRIASPENVRVQGTGLGLFISKEIIEKHNGSLWFEPKEQGNAFIFQLERG